MLSPHLVRLAGPFLIEIKSALRSAGLPADDLREDITNFYRLQDGAGPLAWAAFERHGDEALLRSVLAAEGRRGNGAGPVLLRLVFEEARREGIARLWLLTETAAPFFEGLGFSPTDRRNAPSVIRKTTEFRGVCPSSAACLAMSLRP